VRSRPTGPPSRASPIQESHPVRSRTRGASCATSPAYTYPDGRAIRLPAA
jgi:hypothetical protein